MHGISRTPNTLDLNLIFFKIRETRCPKTRRSWQRRARLALAQRDDLTPSERHEICSIWSRSNISQIDSPAMSKLLKKEHRPQPHQTISARSCTRRRFDAPSVDCSVSRSSHALDSAPRHQANCKPQHALWRPLTILFQGCTYQRLPRDNDELALLSDSLLNQRRRRERKPERCKPPKITKITRILCSSKFNPSKKQRFTAHEMSRRI